MEFKCEQCNKSYKSYQSRWNHVKKCHKDCVVKNVVNVVEDVVKDVVVKKTTECIYCNKVLADRISRWRHEQKCNKKIDDIHEDKLILLEQQNEKLESKIEELKDLLLKSMKIHPKTLNKINKQLNNSGVINNTTNNIQIVQLGEENLNELLSKQEKIKILNQRGHSLKEIVNLVHISDKFTQFRNIYITNLQNSIGYKYDTKTNSFIAVNKSVLLDDIIDCRMCDIETFYNELEDKLDSTTTTAIKRFIDRMNDEDDKLKGVKKEELKLLLYNSREKITGKKDIDL